MKSDLLITFLNGLAVLAGVFFLNGMIARMHGLDVLGEFSYIRRIITSCISVLLFGMNVGSVSYTHLTLPTTPYV